VSRISQTSPNINLRGDLYNLFLFIPKSNPHFFRAAALPCKGLYGFAQWPLLPFVAICNACCLEKSANILIVSTLQAARYNMSISRFLIGIVSATGLQQMWQVQNQNPFNTDTLGRLRQQTHPLCVVCSPANPLGLKVEYTLNPDGSVEGSFTGGPMFQGYDGMLHGGVIASLLDGAMTNCMFACGCVGVTAELKVRYRKAVAAGEKVTIRAWLVQSNTRLYQLRAELMQTNSVKAAATAKFMEKPI